MKLKKLALKFFALTSIVSVAQDFNYGEALQKSLFFYEAQQSGELPDWNRVSWRGDSTSSDGSDVGLDLNGGWFDAGDHVKFNFPMAYSVTTLAWGAIEYKEAYEDAGQLEILKRNLKFVTDYFIKCHTGPTELYGQVGGGTIDHAWWGSAELVDLVMERPSFKIDAENPGSDLAAETAAALAATSMLFADSDPDYSNELLEHAIELYDFADNYRGKYSDSIADVVPFYNSWSGYNDEIVWGAIWMYRATGDESYLQKAESEYENLGVEIGQDVKAYKWGLAWDDKSYGCYILMSLVTGDDKYMIDAERHLDFWITGYNGEKVAYSPGGQAHLTQWGSLRHSANTSLLALIYSDKVISGTSKASTYHDFAVTQIDYALGENPINRSFMVGYGNDPANSVHHRTAHGAWANSLQDDPVESSHILYGALAGGPSSPDDTFEDDRGDFIANEVACDYNACFTGALARLYSEYGGNPLTNFPIEEEPTRTEIRTFSTFNSNNASGSTVKTNVQNRTAWPARITDKLVYKYFIDISEAVAEGYTIDDYSFSLGGSSEATIKDVEVWDAATNVYAVVVSFEGVEIAPTGDPAFRREAQIDIRVSAGVPYDTTNDWSAEGLDTDEFESVNIPIYDNGVLVFGQEPPGGDTPKALFIASVDSGFAPLEVSFDSSDSSDPNGDNITYLWNFDNGETSTVANPTITFSDVKKHTVSLVVSDGTNTSAPYTIEIDVQDGNFAPVANIDASATSGIAPFEIDFNASGSTDENGDDLTYLWNFDDGTTSTLESVSHTFTDAGEYEVSLTVSDGVKSDTEKVTITLNDGSPVISYTYSVETVEIPFEVNFDASGSTDPEGGSLSYAWDFGNGASGEGATPTASYTDNGEYLVTLVVTNGSGKDSEIEFYIEVGDSNCKFNTPSSSPIEGYQEAYQNVFVLGEDGPDLSNVSNFTIDWDLDNNTLHSFAMNTTNGIPAYYMDLIPIVNYSFNTSSPEISVQGSQIPNFDGDYYVTTHEGNFVMVSKSGGFTLYFSTSANEPECPDVTLSNPSLDIANYEIRFYPNPTSDIVNIVVKTTVDLDVNTQREVIIVNLLGQKVKSKMLSTGASLASLNVQDLSTGIYIVQINVGNKLLVAEKLIVE